MEETKVYLFIEPREAPAFWVPLESGQNAAKEHLEDLLGFGKNRESLTITAHVLTPSEYAELSKLDHIDDWCFLHTYESDLDYHKTLIKVKHWFREFRRPAVMLDREYLESKRLSCDFEGERWYCIGASRMGDVWLTKDADRTHGYDRRVMRTDCTNWEIEDRK